jgi:hypothetical protein
LLTLFIAACGDSNDFQEVSGQRGNSNQNLAFVGSWLGANNLGAGQSATLSMTVANSGQATGSLTVDQPLVSNQAVTIPTGTYPLSGTVNLATGAFSLSGTLTGLGPISISGQLPIGNSQGAYSITINGQTFSGVIQNADLGTPTPPSNDDDDDDDDDDDSGNSHLILGGTLSNFVFTPDGSYNGANPPVDESSLITGAVVTGSAEENAVTIAISETTIGSQGAQVTALAFGVVTHDGEPLEVGHTYPLVSTEDGDGSVVSLSDTTGTTITSDWISTEDTTGSVTITALTDDEVELDFTFTGVAPNPEVEGNESEGTFSTSGHVSADFAASGT